MLVSALVSSLHNLDISADLQSWKELKKPPQAICRVFTVQAVCSLLVFLTFDARHEPSSLDLEHMKLLKGAF